IAPSSLPPVASPTSSRRTPSLEAAPSVVLRRTPPEILPTAEGPTALRRLSGHADWVKAVVFTPDGRRLVTTSLDHTVRLWDANNGVELACGMGHEDGVLCVALSPDSTTALTGGIDRTLRRWSLADGLRETAVLRGHTENVNDIAFSVDGARALSASHDG